VDSGDGLARRERSSAGQSCVTLGGDVHEAIAARRHRKTAKGQIWTEAFASLLAHPGEPISAKKRTRKAFRAIPHESEAARATPKNQHRRVKS